MPGRPDDVRSRGQSGSAVQVGPLPSLTPMYGPAVRCKWFRRAGGERSRINVSGLWLEHLLRAIMDISARAFSLPDRPRLDHLGHQCSHAPGRPNLHHVSSSRRPRLEIVDRVTSSLAPHTAQFLCSSQGRSFVPARRTSIASRAGAVKAGRCAWLAAGSGVARPRLDGAEHGARIKRVGRLHRRSSSARRRVL